MSELDRSMQLRAENCVLCFPMFEEQRRQPQIPMKPLALSNDHQTKLNIAFALYKQIVAAMLFLKYIYIYIYIYIYK